MALDERDMIIFVTAGNCGNCTSLTQSGELQNLMNKLRETKKLRVDQTKVAQMWQPIDTKLLKWPDAVNKFVPFYPSIIRVDGRSWNNSLVDPNISINAKVYNTRFDQLKGRLVPIDDAMDISVSTIVAWATAGETGVIVPSRATFGSGNSTGGTGAGTAATGARTDMPAQGQVNHGALANGNEMANSTVINVNGNNDGQGKLPVCNYKPRAHLRVLV